MCSITHKLFIDDDKIDENDDRYIPERDDALTTFKNHTGPVFCGAFHPSEELIVTGGEDDRAFVWNMHTGDVVFEVTGHSDTLIASEFSYDGVYLATGDMAGQIQVFKVAQDYKKVWEFTMGDMCWMKWHFGAHVLLAGSDTGEIYVWRIPSGDCKVMQGFGAKCETAKLTPDGKKLAAGYGDGTFKVWEIRNNSIVVDIPSGHNQGHSEGVTSVAVDRDNQLFISGCEEGKVVISNISGPVATLMPNDGSVEDVLLDSPDFEIKVAATGTLNGKVTIWDVAKQSARVECEDPDRTGITRMQWGRNNTIIAGTLGGKIKIWDLRSGQLVQELLGHSEDVHDIVLNKEKTLLLSMSEDKTAKIFNLNM